MIDINKTYRTRDGHEVRIYATDGEHGELVHGAAKHKENGWQSWIWFADGNFLDGEENRLDLIEVRPRHKLTVWLTVWSDYYIEASNKPERRNGPLGCGEEPIACIKVDLDFEEGEGL